jgi:hypothetical protein
LLRRPRSGQAPRPHVWQELVWGIGPIALALIWLAVKRDLSAARFGLFVFAVLYLVIAGLNLWWHDLV